MKNHAREYFLVEVISLLGTVIPTELISYAKDGTLSLPGAVVATLMVLNTIVPPVVQAYRAMLAAESAN